VGRGARGLLVAAIAAFAALMPGLAIGHPLGNFTVSTSVALVLRPHEVVVDLVVDMAEIPALRERHRVDIDGDGDVSGAEAAAYRATSCRSAAAGLRLAADGGRLPLSLLGSALRFPPGEAGLSTLRLSCVWSAPLEGGPSHGVSFESEVFADRPGWREVIAAADSTTILRSDVPAESPTGRLRSYPADAAPLAVTAAQVAFRAGGPPLAGDVGGAGSRGPEADLLSRLAGRADLDAGPVLVLAAVALAFGAAHALGPGHGKTLIGASMLSGGIRQAFGVGAAVATMHTASVLALGVVVIAAERVLSPDALYPALGLASGLLALGLGSRLLVVRLRELRRARAHRHEHPLPARPLSRAGLAAIAVAGGILPSPTALVVLLGSISVGRAWLGLLLVAGFSVGLAASLTAVGLLASGLGRGAKRRLPAAAVRAMPVVSAGCITVVGAVLTVRGLVGP
jgi:nickel/cobalt exporter